VLKEAWTCGKVRYGMKQGMRLALVLLSLALLLRVVRAAADEKTEVLATVGEETITLQDFVKVYKGRPTHRRVRSNYEVP